MTPYTGIGELDAILHRLEYTVSRDEHHERLCELAATAPKYINELDSLLDAGTYARTSLIWCLTGQDDPRAIALFAKALIDKDKYTRWAAARALSECNSPNASALPVAALKDRALLVRGTAVDAFIKFRNPVAIPQLKRIAASDNSRVNPPGMIESARKALANCQEGQL